MKNTSKKQSYILVLDWMVDKYRLKGNELLAYALIYGFSQDGDSEYKGSFSYLSRWLGADRATIIRVLKRLESKGLISKRQELVNGQMVNRYVAEVPDEINDIIKEAPAAPENQADSPALDQSQNATGGKTPLVAKRDGGWWQNATGGGGKTPPSNTTGNTTGNTTPSGARCAHGGGPTPMDVFAEYAKGDKPLLDALTKFDAYRSSRRGKVWDAQAARAVCAKLTQLADEAKATKRTEYMIASIMQSIEAGWSVLDHPKSWGSNRITTRAARRIVDRPEPSGNDFLANAAHRRSLCAKKADTPSQDKDAVLCPAG